MFAASVTGVWLLVAALPIDNRVTVQPERAVRLPFIGSHRPARVMDYRGYYRPSPRGRGRTLHRRVPQTGLRFYGVPFFAFSRGRFDRWR